MDTLLRLAIVVVVLAVVAAAIYAARWFARKRREAHRGDHLGDIAARLDLPKGAPAILYFWGDRCVQCVSLQQPALARLTADRDIHVTRIEAAADVALARRFGIVTVPSTVVVGPDLRVREVNLGFADATQLAAQLNAS